MALFYNEITIYTTFSIPQPILTNSWMSYSSFENGKQYNTFCRKSLLWMKGVFGQLPFQLLTNCKQLTWHISEDAASGLEQGPYEPIPGPGMSEKWVRKRKCRWLCSCLRAPRHESQYQLEPPYRNWLRHWSWKLLDSTSWNILSF